MYSHHPVRLSWVVTVYDTALSDNAQMEYLAHCSWLITRSISGYGNTTLVHEVYPLNAFNSLQHNGRAPPVNLPTIFTKMRYIFRI